MLRRTKGDPLPKEGRIDLKTTISPREYAEVRMYQDIEYDTMIALINSLLRYYIKVCRKKYAADGLLEGMLNRLK